MHKMRFLLSCLTLMDSSTFPTQPWFGAQEHCQSLGGNLVVIDSSDIQSGVNTLLQATSFPTQWIGLRQTAFYWSNGSAASPSNIQGFRYLIVMFCISGELISNNLWMESQPHLTSGLGCVRLLQLLVESGSQFVPEFGWIASECDGSAAFVCEISPSRSSELNF